MYGLPMALGSGFFSELIDGIKSGSGRRYPHAPILRKTFLYLCSCVGKLVGMVVAWRVKAA